MTLLTLLSIFLFPATSYAERLSLRSSITQIQEEQTQLQNKLQEFGLIGNQIIIDNQKKSKQVTTFMWVTFILAAMMLGLIWSIIIFYRKYKIALHDLQKSSKKVDSNKQFQTNQIANIQHSISEQRQQFYTIEQQSKENITQISKELSQLHHTFNTYQDQGSLADEQLEKLLNNRVDYTLTSKEKSTLHTLIVDNNLSFSGNLKARALSEEEKQAWQQAIGFWNTILIEDKQNTEALLHIGYANYQLAIEDSKNSGYTNQSMQAFEKIMLSAPEYFDDMQGYDGEEHLSEANDFESHSKEYNLFQQLEEFIIKLDELRNYQSIYMLACDYATDGNVNDAQNCLEQIPSIFHAPHCKQLQKDKNLSVLKQFDWFNELIQNACQKKVTI